jgi:hypothetical protein
MMYTEFVVCYEALEHAMCLTNFILGLRMVDKISISLTIYCDNRAAVFFSHNNNSSGTTKHIDIRYLVMRERV